MERYIRIFLFCIFMMFGLINNAFAGYTGPSLKLPVQPGGSILCTVETGGRVAPIIGGGTDSWHTDSENGYYAIDFDDRYSGDLAVAVASGTVSVVVNSGCSNGGDACYVKVDHGGGYVTTYYHLENGSVPNDVFVGATVQQGQELGTIGSTGEYSTGAHLHFSIKYNGSGYSYTSELDGVEMEGIPFVDFVAGNYYESTNDGTCTPTPVSPELVVMSEDNGAFDLHQYYVSDEDGDGQNKFTLTDANPVINNQGSSLDAIQWLSGDVNGDGYTDLVLVSFPTTSWVEVSVWLSNGDGTFQSEDVWKSESTLLPAYNHYFLGDVNADDSADLVVARDGGSGAVIWYQCLSSGVGFETCGAFGGPNSKDVTFGQVFTDNVFLLGDVTGDGKADVVRGYNTQSQIDTCSTGGYNLKWRVMRGGQTETDPWGDNSGCSNSIYRLGDVDGNFLQDLIEFRFEQEYVVPVYVRTSTTGDEFDTEVLWKNKFGSQFHTYAVYDVTGDGYDDLISHSSNGVIRVTASTGSSFQTGTRYKKGVKFSDPGSWLFGNYGSLDLDSEVCETTTASVRLEEDALVDVSGTVYVYQSGVFHGIGSETVFTACGYDWSSVVEMSSSVFATYTQDTVYSNSFDCGVVEPGDLLHWNNLYYQITSEGKKQPFGSDLAYAACEHTSSEAEFLADGEYPVVTTLQDDTTLWTSLECGVLTEGDLVHWNGTVYRITDTGLKRGFTSQEVFNACGYDWDLILYLTDAEYPVVTTLQDGSAISSTSDCSNVQGDLVHWEWTGTVYYLTGTGYKRGVTSTEAMTSCGLDWNQVRYVTNANGAVVWTLGDAANITGSGDCP